MSQLLNTGEQGRLRKAHSTYTCSLTEAMTAHKNTSLFFWCQANSSQSIEVNALDLRSRDLCLITIQKIIYIVRNTNGSSGFF